MSEFCPKCYYPLDKSDDDSRLCIACQWFGDKTEVRTKPPDLTPIELVFLQLTTLYRDVCRLELFAEQLAEGRPEHQNKLAFIKTRVAHSRHSLLHLFRGTRK